jgi:hypothetical protein
VTEPNPNGNVFEPITTTKTIKTPYPILDGNGNCQVTKPWPLDGNGNAKPSADDAPAVLTFHPYTPKSWAGLYLV